jgi:aryl-alcohol dehydrogenase-like predicted oxidoreductase
MRECCIRAFSPGLVYSFDIMSISGCATSTGTTHYSKRFPTAANSHFRRQQNVLLSSLGIGTYLGGADPETDENYKLSITRAVELGVNVIDSAANYRFQRSERSIGHAIRGLVSKGFTRDELVVCTKGGYLPFDGSPPRDVRRYVEETFVRPGIAEFADFVGGSHCMTPSYLDNQLAQSLKNLEIDCVDVYYIHNPESQLGDVSEEEFYKRIEAAFAFLETARAQSRIQYYGVATWNGFRVGASSGQFHSLERLVQLARTKGGDNHGFRFIQLPFNLAMPEALTLRNQSVNGSAASTLEAANAFGVTVVASASILQGRVGRGLPQQVREALGAFQNDTQTAIQFVRSTPGITTALVGMSRVSHVEENLQLVKIEPADEEHYSKLFVT